LNLVVFGAAVLQSAAGFGFGVVAGPVLLLQMNSADAVTVSILLNLVVAGVLTPTLWPYRAKVLLNKLVISSLLGLPLGVWILISIDFVTLKLLAGIAVLLAAISVLWRRPETQAIDDEAGDRGAIPFLIGGLAGVMGGSLAMPGPAPAAWMAKHDYGKQSVRSTILALFLFVYAGALILHIGINGFLASVLWQSAALLPATLVGIYVGGRLVGHLSESFFKGLILIVLAGSAGSLFWSIL